MAKLSTKERKKIPSNEFGLPGRRGYPMPDASHAGNAKARAAAQVGKTITKAQEKKIDRKANRVIKAAGGHPSPVGGKKGKK